MKKIFFCLMASGLLITQGYSQNVTVTPATLNVTGGTHAIGNYNFEWSFGEAIAIETMTSGNTMIAYVTNGILQPLSAVPILNDCWGPKEIKIFPNPTTGLFEVNFYSLEAGKVTLRLFDESGRLLEIIPSFDYAGIGYIKAIDLSRYPSGAYLVNIILQPTGNSKIKQCTYIVVKFR